MLRKTTLLLFILGGTLFGSAQTIHIETDSMAEDDQFNKSQSILPIFKFTSPDIEEYSKFGVATDQELQYHTIEKMPDMSRCNDTGYTFIYFSGADNEERQGHLITLVGNYVRSKRTIYFFIDRNNDLDFTNDGAPDSITMEESEKLITLHNIHAPKATYSILLTRFRYGENVRYKNLLTDHYKNNSGNKVFTDINYCFREQRYNTVVGHYRSETDSFTIGIKDMNVNGLYNEACTDMLYVGAYESTVMATELFYLTPTISKNGFEWNGKKYKFVQIDGTGSYIEIKEDPNAVLSNKLEIGKRTPGFTYYNILNKPHELKEYKKSQVYIFFWDIDNLSDEDTLYLGKIHREFKDEIKLITLNHGDEPRMVRITYYYDNLSFPVGYSNTSIAKDYFMEDVPRGYYLDKRCKLIDDKISPKEMYETLVGMYKSN
ncbi:hypothetical protein GYB29_09905 [bacterium]|nr:hypothetical protein [bacterium]